MLTTIRGFLNRHRRKFIIGGILIGGAVLASQYARKKLREWQERETKEFLECTLRRHHFESTERTCNQTILSLTPTVREAIIKSLDTEDLVIKLRSGPSDKVLLWEELKILAFTRASVLVYAEAMLVLTLRIQLNLIGGYMYQDSTNQTEGRGARAPHISSALQHNYLSFCHHFVNEGIRELCTLVEEKVRLIVEGTSLKQKLSLQHTEQLFWAIQAGVTGDPRDPIKCLARYFLPPDRPAADCDTLQKMVSETMDLLESDEVISLTSSCVSQGFSLMVDRISDYYGLVPDRTALNMNAGPSGVQNKTQILNNIVECSSNSHTNFIHPNNVAMPMAKLIPIVNGLVQHLTGHEAGRDPWIQQLILDDKLKLLGANVYEAFSNK
jgi:peroxin-3